MSVQTLVNDSQLTPVSQSQNSVYGPKAQVDDYHSIPDGGIM